MFSRNFPGTINRLLDIQRSLEAAGKSDYFEFATTSRGTYPPVNLLQDGDNTILTVELPGMRKEDIKIEVKGNLIRIFGERKVQYPKGSSVHRLERRGRSFDRTLKLPIVVERDEVKAEYNNGVLKVIMVRAEKDKPKLVEIA